MFPEEWESVYSFSNLLHQLNSPHFQRWKEKKPCNTKIGKICRVDDGSAITGKQHDVIFFTGLVSL